MKSTNTLVCLAALLTVGPACVPLEQYKKLEERFEEQETYVTTHKNQVRELERREQAMTLRSREQEKQLELLKARLAKSERLRRRLEEEATQVTSVPASAPQPQPEVMGLEVNPNTQGLVLENGLLFAPGKATLKKSGAQLLDRLIGELNSGEYAHRKVRVDGHTDDTPIKHSRHESNWDLSAKRALAVLHHLETHGIDSDRLYFSGFGPHEPLSPGSDSSARAKNRRVEIVLFDE